MKLRPFISLLTIIVCIGLYAQPTASTEKKHYTFEDQVLGSEWQHVGKPDSTMYCFAEGRLRLKGSIYELHEDGPSTFMGLKRNASHFVAETRLSLFDTENGDEAGLCLFRSREGYVQCCLNNFQGSRRLKLRLQLYSHRLMIVDRPVGSMSEVWLRVTSDGEFLRFTYSTDGKRYQKMDDVEWKLLSPQLVGGEDHFLIGLFSFMGSTKYNAGTTFGDFDYFDYYETHP